MQRYRYWIKRCLSIALIVSGLVGVLALGLYRPVYAHPGGPGYRYVANNGVDQGTCDNPLQPCRTLLYAIRQADKGDEIRLAKGVYFTTAETLKDLVSTIIPVRGGFAVESGFRTYDPQINQTYLIGVSSEHRTQLTSQGFALLPDAKGVEIEADSAIKAASVAATLQGFTPCVNGQAGEYPCNGLDFLGRIALDQFSTNPTSISDIWGHIDLNTNREYALVGLNNGTAVVDVTDPINPVEVDVVPGSNAFSGGRWRDIKVYQFQESGGQWRAYAYVTTESTGQGLQIIDLNDLPNSATLAATYDDFSSAHNIYISHVDYTTNVTITGETAYAYVLGSNQTGGKFKILDLSDPTSPTEISTSSEVRYAHDGTTLVITDSRTADCQPGHNPCDLYIDFTGFDRSVDIWDVTDKANPHLITTTLNVVSNYSHSGWWSQDKNFLFIQDEIDEFGSNKTRLRTLDISDLSNPFISNIWTGLTTAKDHNGYTKGDRYYMSNYQRGLTVFDVSDPNNPLELAYFDTDPASNFSGSGYHGAWGVYPFLPSDTLLISDIERGLILVREQEDLQPIDLSYLYLPLISKSFSFE